MCVCASLVCIRLHVTCVRACVPFCLCIRFAVRSFQVPLQNGNPHVDGCVTATPAHRRQMRGRTSFEWAPMRPGSVACSQCNRVLTVSPWLSCKGRYGQSSKQDPLMNTQPNFAGGHPLGSTAACMHGGREGGREGRDVWRLYGTCMALVCMIRVE